jgi:hypothetical protein
LLLPPPLLLVLLPPPLLLVLLLLQLRAAAGSAYYFGLYFECCTGSAFALPIHMCCDFRLLPSNLFIPNRRTSDAPVIRRCLAGCRWAFEWHGLYVRASRMMVVCSDCVVALPAASPVGLCSSLTSDPC